MDIRAKGVTRSKLFNTLAIVMIGLLLIVMASAAYRMKIYVGMSGVTMLRIYVISIIAWMVFIFGWFVATVLRGQSQRFAWGSLVGLLTTVFAINVFNPEAFSAQIDMTRNPKNINAEYITTLGADAVPAVVRNFDRANPEEKATLLQWLKERREEVADADIRGWSYSTSQAKNALAPLQATLDKLPEVQRYDEDDF